jgi:fatty-acyl-CoA synthase
LLYDVKFREMALYLQEHCQVAALLEIDTADESSPYEQALAAHAEGCSPVSMSQDDTTMIMYTSGTTGHPKGAEITHQMNLYNCINLGVPGRISPDTVHLVALPLFHTGGLNCYANPVLHAGGQVLLLREFSPGAALKIMGDAELGVTHFFAIPAAYQFMMLHPDFESTDFSRIKVAGVGGAPCAETILKTWLAKGVSVFQGWGMTETSPGGTALNTDDAVRKLGSAGKPVLHTEIKIVDDEGNTVPQGDVGELLIKGPNITPGYWNDPKATAEAFVDGWLKTGDAARCDDEGFIYIVDRSKDMYISGGENVYPAEIENVLYELPQVAEAAVIGVPDKRWGEIGMAVLVLKEGASLEDKAVIDHCRKNLAKFKVPHAIEHIDALPRNATGKVLKRVLRDRFVGEGAPAIT